MSIDHLYMYIKASTVKPGGFTYAGQGQVRGWFSWHINQGSTRGTVLRHINQGTVLPASTRGTVLPAHQPGDGSTGYLIIGKGDLMKVDTRIYRRWKGKTTAAVGLGIRACGWGLDVLMVQFLKSLPTGEELSLKKLEPGFMLYRGTSNIKFVPQMSEEESRTAKEQLSIFTMP